MLLLPFQTCFTDAGYGGACCGCLFFFFLLFCQCFVTFWGLWQETELPTWTWSQGHVNTDICFKPRVDTLLSLPLIFAFHAHVTLFILQPIWPCLHEGHVQFTTKRRNVFGLNLQEGIFAAVLYSFHPSFDLPFAISSRQKKKPSLVQPVGDVQDEVSL